MNESYLGQKATQFLRSANNSIVEAAKNGSASKPHQTQLDFIMRLITYPTCMIAGVLGNILVITIILRRKKAKRSNIYETFLMNLAFTDCGVLLVQFLIGIVIGPMLQWHLGKFICYILIPLGDVFLPASSFTLLAISLIRYRGIMYPFKPKISGKGSALIISLIWVVSIVLGVSPFIPWLKTIYSPGKLAQCSYNIPFQERILWFVSVFAMLFAVPVATIWVIYFRLRKRLFEAVEDLSGVLNKSYRSSHREVENKKAIKMVFIVTALFTLLYFPFFVTTCLHFFLDHSLRALRVSNEIALFCICLNSTVNPIIYCIINKSYRRELMVMFSLNRLRYRRKSKELNQLSSAGPLATFSKYPAVETNEVYSSNWV